MEPEHEALFLEVFPCFLDAPAALMHALRRSATYRTVPAGIPLEIEGEYASDLAFVLSGEKRIFKRAESRREITLYEIGAGDICVLNAAAILARARLSANTQSLSDVRVLCVPAEEARRLVDEFAFLRNFVFRRIHDSLESVLALVFDVAFVKMDDRLQGYLIEKSENGELCLTHQRIANALGTSREVVTRLLASFQAEGLVSLARNRITLNGLQR